MGSYNPPSAEKIEQLLSEGVISANKAAAGLPSVRGKGRHAGTIIRWILDGRHGVKLEGFRGPDRTWFTTRKALARFFAAITALEDKHRPDFRPSVVQQAEQAERAAERRQQLREQVEAAFAARKERDRAARNGRAV